MVHVQKNMVLSRYAFIEVPLCNMLEQYQPSFFVLSLVILKYLEYHCLKYLEYYLNTIEHEHSNYSVLLLGVGGTESCVIFFYVNTVVLCSPYHGIHQSTFVNHLIPTVTHSLSPQHIRQDLFLSGQAHRSCLCPQL